MNVNKINISNILNVETLEIRPGKVTQITGGNEKGKTSVLEAIKASLTGGHDASLLRNGAEQGEVCLHFDNGDELRKVVTSDKSDLKYRHEGKLAKNVPTLLDELRDVISVNPVEFLNANDKRRMEIILESLNLTLTDEQLTEAAGFACKVGPNVLESIGAVRKSIYDERTGVNRAEKEKRNTVNQLSETIPTDVQTDDGSSALMNLQTQLDQVNQNVQLAIHEYSIERDTKVADIVRQIQELEAQRNAINEEFAQRRLAKIEEGNALTAPIKEKMAVVAEQEQQRGRYEQQKEVIAQMDKECDELQKKSTDLTSAIERLDALRLDLMKNLPFAGLVLQDGKTYLNGVDFDRVCSSDQVRFCLQLAVHRAQSKSIKIICVDGLELIDGERYIRFVEVAKQLAETLGVQFFVTRVTTGDLQILTEE